MPALDMDGNPKKFKVKAPITNEQLLAAKVAGAKLEADQRASLEVATAEYQRSLSQPEPEVVDAEDEAWDIATAAVLDSTVHLIPKGAEIRGTDQPWEKDNYGMPGGPVGHTPLLSADEREDLDVSVSRDLALQRLGCTPAEFEEHARRGNNAAIDAAILQAVDAGGSPQALATALGKPAKWVNRCLKRARSI